jgi:hypothetical protein
MPGRQPVPIEVAIARLTVDAEGEVHTFLQGRAAIVMLVGMSYPLDEIVRMMREHGVEEAGDAASALDHTLVIVDGLPSPLFIAASRPPEPVNQSTSQPEE